MCFVDVGSGRGDGVDGSENDGDDDGVCHDGYDCDDRDCGDNNDRGCDNDLLLMDGSEDNRRWPWRR